jgi:dipeptidyl aminopeptidase/acylaminoacyl peptidase
LDGATPPAAGDVDGLVAYVGGADPQIYLLDLGSGQSRQLTHLGPDDAELTASGPMRPVLTCGFGPSGLQWAPDGARLAFAYGGCDSVVHVVELDGTLRRIGDGRSPAWSPDGRQLVFGPNYPYLGVSADRSWPLLAVDMDGGDTTPRPLGDVPAGFYAGSPSFSADGELVAFTGPMPGSEDPTAPAAYVMRADGADLVLVAQGAWPAGWLPDGRLVVIEPTTGGSSAADLGSGDFTPVAGGDPVEAISPDGSLLLASAIGDAGNRVRLYRVSGELVGEINGFAPTWSPDGTAFLVNDVDILLVIGVDGTELDRHELTGPVGGDGRARWQPAVP